MAKPPAFLQAPRLAWRGATNSFLGPAAQALLAALLLVVAKLFVHLRGWEILDTGLPVLTALLGAVVFTMGIVLSGVLQDFKEAERILGELVSQVRRLHWDITFSGADAATIAAFREQLLHFVMMVRENARHGMRWRLRDLHSPIDAMDGLLVNQVRAPWPTTRTVQVGLATLTRTVDRLEVIVETTFMRAGYAFAAAAIGVVLGGFLLAPLGSAVVAGILYGSISFILVGVYVLIRDLDNPMAGSVRISTLQVEKLATLLKERQRPAAETVMTPDGPLKP